MDSGSSEGSEARFASYVEALGAVLGHADRQEPMRDYCLGLLMPIERKSVEPMAAVTAPAQVAAKHQSLLHFVGNAPWSDAAMLGKVAQLVLPAVERSGPIEAWIIDDTGFPKKGRHSVGVTRQYCGQLGKQDNCQVAVSLSLANHDASLPIAYRLYLPEDWSKDQARRGKARVPETIAFQTKPTIAIEQIKAAQTAGTASGGRADGRRLWQRHGAADRDHLSGLALRRGDRSQHLSVAAGRGSRAAAVSNRSWTTADAAAARTAPADLGQDTRPQPAARGVANDYLARGNSRLALLALCPAANAAGASR